MIIKKAELEAVAGVTTKELPVHRQPEIAFAGRSNVGKSTLINALMNRRNLARVSGTPGKTQTINYYHINDEFYLVDLPGYGYAKVQVDFRKAWGPMIEKYFRTSKVLKAVFLLLDIRRIPSAEDRQMYDWIRANGFEPIIIVTKSDKLKRSQRAKAIRDIRDSLEDAEDICMIPFSGLDKSGREEIYKVMEELI